MTPNTFKAVVRSLTPWVISGVVYVAVHLGWHVSMVTATEVAAILGTLLTIAAHYLETKWRWFGLLLGWLGAPAYNPTITKAQLAQQVLALQAQLDQQAPEVPTLAPGAPAPVA